MAGALILSLLPSRKIFVGNVDHIERARHYYKAEIGNLKLSRDLLDLAACQQIKGIEYLVIARSSCDEAQGPRGGPWVAAPTRNKRLAS